jgi:hypothetical protein
MLWQTLHTTRMCPFRLAAPPPTRAAGLKTRLGESLPSANTPAVFSAEELTACPPSL